MFQTDVQHKKTVSDQASVCIQSFNLIGYEKEEEKNQLKLFDTAVILEYGQGQQKWYEHVMFNE